MNFFAKPSLRRALFGLALTLPLAACDPGGPGDPDAQNETPNPDNSAAKFKELRAKGERAQAQTLSTSDQEFLRQSSVDLSLALLRHPSKAKDNKISVSPYSLRHAFGMSLGMARGDTQKEIIDTLKLFPQAEQNHRAFNSIAQTLNSYSRPKEGWHKELIVDSVNRFFIAEGVQAKDDYLQTLNTYYGTGLYQLDLSDPDKTRKDINAWVKQKTRKLIPELLGSNSITDKTTWVIVNALSLKVAWAENFGRDSAKPGSFELANGETVERTMMSNPESSGRFGTGENFRWGDIDLDHKSLGFLVIVPESKQWDKVFNSISGKTIHEMLKRGKEGDIDLTLPKFNVDSSLALKPILKDLGLKTPFDPERADFSGLHDQSGMHIDKVIQQTVLAVSEKGIQAAAATAIEEKSESASVDPPFKLSVDRPFLFMIHDRNTGAVLFSGRVLDPK